MFSAEHASYSVQAVMEEGRRGGGQQAKFSDESDTTIKLLGALLDLFAVYKRKPPFSPYESQHLTYERAKRIIVRDASLFCFVSMLDKSASTTHQCIDI